MEIVETKKEDIGESNVDTSNDSSRKPPIVGGIPRHFLGGRRGPDLRNAFPNPVAARNRNRPKTDSR